MRTLFGVGLVFVCLGLAGCSLFGKKKSTADASSRNDSGVGVARNDAPSAEPPGPPPGANGLLAGQVIDSFNRTGGGALIQVVDLQDTKIAGKGTLNISSAGDVTAVEIEPLPRSGGGRNWKLGAIQPTLPELARREAEAAVAPLYGQYDLIEDR